MTDQLPHYTLPGVNPLVDSLARLGLERPVVVGRGGFGVVYRAWQPQLRRTVAIKFLTGTRLEAIQRERFEREGAAMGALSGHPHIVTVFDAGVIDGRPYISMEYLQGGSLGQRLRRDGALRWAETIDVGVKLASALEVAHRGGVLHRDVKPENVLISQYGEPKLADFGIARVRGAQETGEAVLNVSLAFAPPEVLAGVRPQPCSDVYMLASTLLCLIRGAPAFIDPDDETIFATVGRIRDEPPPDLRPLGVPPAVCEVLEWAMAKDPARRYATAEELGRALQRAQRAGGVAETPLTIGESVERPTQPQTAVATLPSSVPRRRRLVVAAAATIPVLLVALVLVLLLRGGGGNQAASSSSSTTGSGTNSGAADTPRSQLALLDAGDFVIASGRSMPSIGVPSAAYQIATISGCGTVANAPQVAEQGGREITLQGVSITSVAAVPANGQADALMNAIESSGHGCAGAQVSRPTVAGADAAVEIRLGEFDSVWVRHGNQVAQVTVSPPGASFATVPGLAAKALAHLQRVFG